MTQSWVAPGRVNLIGEHVDYNDGLCMPFALALTTTATVTRRDDDVVRVGSDGRVDTFDVWSSPGEVQGWAAYVAGVVWALRQHGLAVPGLSIEVASDVPIGAGLSSSAALECAVAGAIVDELGETMPPVMLATVARRAENDFVGVPTGPMDQLASVLGTAGHAVLIDCRDLATRAVPFELERFGLTLLIIDTHAAHELTGGEYAERRADCEKACDLLGLDSLRDASLSDLSRLDDELIHRRAQHVVTEIARVAEVAAILDAGRPQDIGTQLTSSHLSLRDDFEVSCDELDVAVEAALAAGALGARMTGGGFGGSAIALVRDDDRNDVADRIRTAYAERRWTKPTIFPGQPSAGARRVDPR